jgi:hypothetical protein
MCSVVSSVPASAAEPSCAYDDNKQNLTFTVTVTGACCVRVRVIVEEDAHVRMYAL